jgi:hypothetical protein
MAPTCTPSPIGTSRTGARLGSSRIPSSACRCGGPWLKSGARMLFIVLSSTPAAESPGRGPWRGQESGAERAGRRGGGRGGAGARRLSPALLSDQRQPHVSPPHDPAQGRPQQAQHPVSTAAGPAGAAPLRVAAACGGRLKGCYLWCGEGLLLVAR